jgi:4'-phosphopantetheinyl transferase
MPNVRTFAFCAKNLASKPPLVAHEIDIWVARLDLPEAAGADVLSVMEHARAESFRSEAARMRFVARRAALRTVLSAYTGVAPASIAFDANDYGKPVLVSDRTLSFSTSHSESVALIALGRCRLIGIDVERVREAATDDEVAARFFTRNEAASLALADAEDRVRCFFNVWTRKEAIVKALGRGLSIPLDSFEVTMRLDESAAITSWNIPGAAKADLQLYHLEPYPGYIGALAFSAGM